MSRKVHGDDDDGRRWKLAGSGGDVGHEVGPRHERVIFKASHALFGMHIRRIFRKQC